MEYSGNDFYCDIALQPDADIKKEYQSDQVLAYHHTQPFWPVHIVVIPKKHIASFVTLSKEEKPIFDEMISVLQDLSNKVEKEHGAARILTNLGEYQDSKHLHFHICSGEPFRGNFL